MQRLLEKWCCLNDECLKSFLVDKATAKGSYLFCPFCKEDAQAVAYQNESIELEDQLAGCLYPSCE